MRTRIRRRLWRSSTRSRRRARSPCSRLPTVRSRSARACSMSRQPVPRRACRPWCCAASIPLRGRAAPRTPRSVIMRATAAAVFRPSAHCLPMRICRISSSNCFNAKRRGFPLRFSLHRSWGTRTAAGVFVLTGGSFSAPAERVRELRKRVRPFWRGSFSLRFSGELRSAERGDSPRPRRSCADAARAHKRVDTCGFHPLVNLPFPLDGLAQIAYM